MVASQLTLSEILTAHRRTIVFGVGALLGLLALATGLATGLDRSLKEIRDGLRSHRASGEVHMVEIDARSLAEINRWPWPGSVRAAAIDRLHDAGARSVAFDVDFSALSQPEEDAKLAAALQRAGGSVILPALRQQ